MTTEVPMKLHLMTLPTASGDRSKLIAEQRLRWLRTDGLAEAFASCAKSLGTGLDTTARSPSSLVLGSKVFSGVWHPKSGLLQLSKTGEASLLKGGLCGPRNELFWKASLCQEIRRQIDRI